MPSGTDTDDLTSRLAVLSDRVRLRMLRILELEELSVGEVARVLQVPQSTASRHLKLLSSAGWLVKRSAGTAAYFSVVADDQPPGSRELWQAVRKSLHAESRSDPTSIADDQRLRGVLAERMNDSRSFFGRVAGDWDDVRRTLFGDRFTARALVGLVPRDWVVADLGCGTGNVSELIAPMVERVYAVDREPAMLEACARRLHWASNVEFIESELCGVPLADGSVDAAICSLVLHHSEDPSAVLREFARLLRSDRGGGLVLVIDMARHDRHEFRSQMGHRWLGFRRSELEVMLTGAGFCDVTVADLPPEAGAEGPGLLVARGRLGPAGR